MRGNLADRISNIWTRLHRRSKFLGQRG